MSRSPALLRRLWRERKSYEKKKHFPICILSAENIFRLPVLLGGCGSRLDGADKCGTAADREV
jgi:hypothetical protein